jgi:L-iditol 2-dehydrogenase
MKAAFLFGKEDLRLQDIPVPVIQEDEILLRVQAAPLCGTDLRMYKAGHKLATPESPLILGHEMSGVIVEVGKKVAHYREGMRVIVGPNIGCGFCELCLSGNTHLCSRYRALGIHLHGAFAEYVRIPEDAIRQGNVFEISAGLSWTEAALIEPLSCVYNAFERAHLQPGETILIFGAGPIGLMHAKMAKMAGAAQVMISDTNPARLKECALLDPTFLTVPGPDVNTQITELTRGKGVDVAITACPAPAAQQLALELAAINGRVIFFGGLPAGNRIVPIDTNLIHYKQILVTGTTKASLQHIRKTLNLLESRLIQVDDLVRDRYAIDQIEEAMAKMAAGQGLKHAIVFDS